MPRPIRCASATSGSGGSKRSDATCRTFFRGELVHLPRPHAETQVFAVDSAAGLPFKLPDGLTPEVGTLLQTTTIALQAVHDASLKLGDRDRDLRTRCLRPPDRPACAPTGCGLDRGVRPDSRSARARRNLGADLVLDPTTTDVGLELRQLVGVGVDVAVEFSGSHAALQQAMRSVRVGGTVIAAGFYAGGELSLGEEFHHNRLTLLARWEGGRLPLVSRAGRDREPARSPRSSSPEKLQRDALITHRLAFADAGRPTADRQPARRGSASNPSLRLLARRGSSRAPGAPSARRGCPARRAGRARARGSGRRRGPC